MSSHAHAEPSVGAGAAAKSAGAAKIALITLAAGQFVMALDTTVMNTAIATVAKDVGTTVTGIQTAITLYTLVMASLMITGGKIGQMIGRKRAFAIGCVIYACGSLTTALSHSLAVLMFGWSFLEGLGAVLIMPAIVALVASNFAKPERPRAYGLVAASAAIAAALGPLIGGLFTTYASWRWVFVGEVLIVLVILALARRMNDTPAEDGARLDLVGTALSALGLGAIVFGILKSGTWGFVRAKPDAPRVARALPRDLADLRRGPGAGRVRVVGGPAHQARSGRVGRTRDAAQPPAPQRGHVIPLHVPDPSRHLLHRRSVPVGRARNLGGPNRRPAAAALTLPARVRRSASPSCAPTRTHGESFVSASCCCSRVSCCWSRCSMSASARRS